MGLNVTNYVLQMKGDKSIASGFDHATRTGDNTFSIYFIDGSKVDLTIPLPSDGQDGISITGVNDLGNGKFTLLLSDGSESDPIQTIKGQKGDKLTFNDLTDEEKASLKGADGFSPTAKVEKVGDTATITITDKDGTTTATIKDGQGGSGGTGEENTIDSISVNGVNVEIDENKNVDITVPSIEGLTKDADLATVAKSGSYEDLSNKPTIPDITGLATETYVDNKVADYTKTVDLADVATSGSYNDLADKPEFETVNIDFTTEY